MLVYHLEVKVFSTFDEELEEQYSNKSDIYSTLEKALEEGKSWINTKLESLYEQSDYYSRKNTLTLEDFLEYEKAYYEFKITEIDPQYADNFILKDNEHKYKELQPTHKTYNYDYKGELQHTQVQYLHKQSKVGYSYIYCPGDGVPEAGTKFKKGDKVKINRSKCIYPPVKMWADSMPRTQIFVIEDVPKKEKSEIYFRNVYVISTADLPKLSGCVWEYQLEKYEDDGLPF